MLENNLVPLVLIISGVVFRDLAKFSVNFGNIVMSKLDK